jgi:hypothetical protein
LYYINVSYRYTEKYGKSSGFGPFSANFRRFFKKYHPAYHLQGSLRLGGEGNDGSRLYRVFAQVRNRPRTKRKAPGISNHRG